MSLSSSQMNFSRAAPRDPEDHSGRRPLSVLDDMRQFRLADEEELLYHQVSRNVPISHKSKSFSARTRSRSSVPNRTAARISARAQVDDIIASEGEINPRIEQQIDEEIDLSRISRLREMNKKRIQELERKLQMLQGLDGTGNDDSATSIYVPSHYEEPSMQEEQNAQVDVSKEQSSTEEQTDHDRPVSSPDSRARAQSPGWRRSPEERSKGQGGYTSDPGRSSMRRHEADGAESDTGGARASVMRAVHRSKSARQSRTMLEPFSFETRIKKPSIIQARARVPVTSLTSAVCRLVSKRK
eukprot:749063-Hanusia_phi.AAC.2